MTVDIASANLITLMLVSLRFLGWLQLAPPLATSGTPKTVRYMLSVALALVIMPGQVSHAPALDGPSIIGSAVLQLFIGFALGFGTKLIFAAVESAGSMIDLGGGFTLSTAYDPLLLSQTSIFSRIHSLLLSTLLFATSAHLFLIEGFVRTFDALPLDGHMKLANLSQILEHGLSQMFVAALQISGPLLVIYFIADVGLGMLTRIAPQLNALQIGFPLKIGATLLFVGFTFLLMPQLVAHLTDAALDLMKVVSGSGG